MGDILDDSFQDITEAIENALKELEETAEEPNPKALKGVLTPDQKRIHWEAYATHDITKGGEGSGNFDHEGRPGEVGGSGEGGGGESGSSSPSKIGGGIKGSSGHAESVKWSKETGREKGYAINKDEDGNYTLGEATEGQVGTISLGKEGNAGFYHTHPNNVSGEPIVDGLSRQDYGSLMTGKSEIMIAQNVDINDNAWMAVKVPGTPTLSGRKFIAWQNKGNGLVGKDLNDYALKYQKGIIGDLDKFGVKLYYGKLGGGMKQIKTLDDYSKVVLKK